MLLNQVLPFSRLPHFRQVFQARQGIRAEDQLFLLLVLPLSSGRQAHSPSHAIALPYREIPLWQPCFSVCVPPGTFHLVRLCYLILSPTLVDFYLCIADALLTRLRTVPYIVIRQPLIYCNHPLIYSFPAFYFPFLILITTTIGYEFAIYNFIFFRLFSPFCPHFIAHFFG